MPAKSKPGETKKRLDVLLTERGLASSRQRAQALILAGHVRVAGKRIDKAGTLVMLDAAIEVVGEGMPYASRGGVKLAGALDDFHILPEGRTCLDVGSSTGGFTDCLLQRGAARVYVVDVTIGQLDWKLAHDPRVVAIEKNARYLQPEDLPEPVDLVTVDVSFISVAKLLPAIVPLTKLGADFLILVKPQFELERRDVGKGGIVRDGNLHERAIQKVRAAAEQSLLRVIGVQPSHLAGAGGNQEFFLHARHSL